MTRPDPLVFSVLVTRPDLTRPDPARPDPWSTLHVHVALHVARSSTVITHADVANHFACRPFYGVKMSRNSRSVSRKSKA